MVASDATAEAVKGIADSIPPQPTETINEHIVQTIDPLVSCCSTPNLGSKQGVSNANTFSVLDVGLEEQDQNSVEDEQVPTLVGPQINTADTEGQVFNDVNEGRNLPHEVSGNKDQHPGSVRYH